MVQQVILLTNLVERYYRSSVVGQLMGKAMAKCEVKITKRPSTRRLHTSTLLMQENPIHLKILCENQELVSCGVTYHGCTTRAKHKKK